ncbi:hypothetical protein SELMODRAFT_418271 [Selaginella moellendorffii]|uniref:Uncharacterized protein n=1 Tax=Selaginella moellendorffii TaxID=88036 RepID=D8S571_SELML|nr:hypothetical protein SELMODRAFT_418271 [Selaginella moellendorffii]
MTLFNIMDHILMKKTDIGSKALVFIAVVDEFLEITRSHIEFCSWIYLLLDLNITTVIEWALAELLHHPDWIIKARRWTQTHGRRGIHDVLNAIINFLIFLLIMTHQSTPTKLPGYVNAYARLKFEFGVTIWSSRPIDSDCELFPFLRVFVFSWKVGNKRFELEDRPRVIPINSCFFRIQGNEKAGMVGAVFSAIDLMRVDKFVFWACNNVGGDIAFRVLDAIYSKQQRSPQEKEVNEKKWSSKLEVSCVMHNAI